MAKLRDSLSGFTEAMDFVEILAAHVRLTSSGEDLLTLYRRARKEGRLGDFMSSVFDAGFEWDGTDFGTVARQYVASQAMDLYYGMTSLTPSRLTGRANVGLNKGASGDYEEFRRDFGADVRSSVNGLLGLE